MSDDRKKRGVGNLILSLAVVGVFVAFLYAVVWRPAPDSIPTVDPTLQLEAARAQADYAVLAPTGLSADWKPTSARFEAAPDGSTTWFLGYVTPDQKYVALAQTDGEPGPYISEQTLDGTPDGEQSIDGKTWQKYISGDQRSLVLVTDESTTVVTGTTDYAGLTDFVGRLS